jgi:hypothetical protein
MRTLEAVELSFFEKAPKSGAVPASVGGADPGRRRSDGARPQCQTSTRTVGVEPDVPPDEASGSMARCGPALSRSNGMAHLGSNRHGRRPLVRCRFGGGRRAMRRSVQGEKPMGWTGIPWRATWFRTVFAVTPVMSSIWKGASPRPQ